MLLCRHVRQAHLRERLGNADNSFELAYCDGNGRCPLGRVLSVARADADIFILQPPCRGVGEARVAFMACITHVPPDCIQVDLALHWCRRCTPRVEGHDVSCDALIAFNVAHVADDENEVKTRQNGALKVDVVHRRLHVVVPPEYRVCGGKHRGTCVQHCGDARLGNGDSLLLHSFVDSHSIFRAHLIKLINAYHTAISQHHSAPLEKELSSLSILHDSGC
mmetsp:Transcript_25912/g.38036  ORF Transcript_25912/g.38036 Transcript_25912/m.38036 type:complete len:221 (+) Transcript_25912:522-1184(+)